MRSPKKKTKERAIGPALPTRSPKKRRPPARRDEAPTPASEPAAAAKKVGKPKKKKKVVEPARGMRGDVVRWDDGRGYGFVKRDDGGPDIFVHQVHLLMDGRRMLDVGQRVEFEEKPGERVEAVQVRVLAVPMHSLDRPSTSLTPRAATSLIPRAVARRAAAGSSTSKRQATDAAPAAAPASKRRTTGPGATKAALKDRRSECG